MALGGGPGRQDSAVFAGQTFQFGQGLRPGQHQQGVARAVMVLLEVIQRRLEGGAVQRQAVSIAGVEASGRVCGGQARGQGQVPVGIGATRPGDEFGVQHLALAVLGVQGQQGRGEHVQQPGEAGAQVLGGQGKEEVGGGLAGAGVEFATQALHQGHQAVRHRIALAAEKEQVFEEVGEARIGAGGLMAAGTDAHQCGRLRQFGILQQGDGQAVGQAQATMMGGGGQHSD
ncbi:hypothetical protein Q3H58_002400 [Pseudomonas psychrotolerans]|nr:hypothetical protein [Pseudomonas psychrotolerans]